MRALFLIALLAFQGQAADSDTPAPTLSVTAPDDAQKCYTGDVRYDGNNAKTTTMSEAMKYTKNHVAASIRTVASSDESLKAFLETRGTCQADCLEAVLSSTIPTLYGNLGKDYFFEGKIMVEAITGAIRACYPSPPRADIHKVARFVVGGDGPGTKFAPEDTEIPEGVTCENDGEEANFPMDDFISQFKEAFEKVVASKPRVKEFFQTVAKDCQFDCLSKTVPATVMTLFLTNNDNKGQGIDALTGAMHACFPGVPSSLMRVVVKATADSMQTATATATTRLYSAKRLKLLTFQGSYSFFPMMGIATAACLLLFFAGVAVGQRSKRYAQVREIDEEQDLITNEQGGLD